MLLFNLCLNWKQLQNMSYKHSKVHILKNSKVMQFLFSEELTCSWNISCLAVIFINNQAKIHIKSNFSIQFN